MQDRDKKRTLQRHGNSLEYGEQGPDSRQGLPFIVRSERLGELRELGADPGTMATDLLEQGSNSVRALFCQPVFSYEATQYRNQTTCAGVRRDTVQLRHKRRM